MKERDRQLVSDLRELHLLLTFKRSLPSTDLLLMQNLIQASVVARAIERICNDDDKKL